MRERLSLCEEVGGGNDGIVLFSFRLDIGRGGKRSMDDWGMVGGE